MVVERINISFDHSLFHHTKAQGDDLTSIYDTNDDTDDRSETYDDEQSESDKQSCQLRMKSRSSQSPFMKNGAEKSRSSPLSSPAHLNLFASQSRPPFSPSKSIAMFEKSDNSLLPLIPNMTLEFNQNLDLVYISPCVIDIMGYHAADMISENSLSFTESINSPLSASIKMTKNDLIQESFVPSCQIFQAANTLLINEQCEEIQISFLAKSKSGDYTSMEGKGMLLEQNSRSTLIWVTRSIPKYQEPKIDVLTDLGLCSICDRYIPVTLFERHTKLCSAAHHAGSLFHS